MDYVVYAEIRMMQYVTMKLVENMLPVSQNISW